MAENDDGETVETANTAVVKRLRRVHSGFLSIDEAVVSHPRYDGGRQTVTRLSLERGDSVALLQVDRESRKVWLTEQFRCPTLAKGTGLDRRAAGRHRGCRRGAGRVGAPRGHRGDRLRPGRAGAGCRRALTAFLPK